MAIQKLTTHSWRGRFRNGLIAGAFIAAYTISAVAPFAVSATVFADDGTQADTYISDAPEAENDNKTKTAYQQVPSLNTTEAKVNSDVTHQPAETADNREATKTDSPTDQRLYNHRFTTEDSSKKPQEVLSVKGWATRSHDMALEREITCEGADSEHPSCEGPKTAHVQTHYNPVCGPNNDEVWHSGDHYRVVKDTGWLANKRIITYLPDTGYVFASASDYSAVLTDHNVPCDSGEDDTVIADPIVWHHQVCGPNNDNVVILPGNHYTVQSDSGWVDNIRTIVYEAHEGYVFADGDYEYVITLTDHNIACEPDDGGNGGVTTPIVLPMPSGMVHEICGPNNDEVTIPSGHYSITSDTGWIHNSRTMVLMVHEGYVFEGGKTTYTLTVTDHNEPCPGEVLGTTTTTPSGPIAPTPTVPQVLSIASPHMVGGKGTGSLENTGTRLSVTIALSMGAILLALVTMVDVSVVRRPVRAVRCYGRVARRRMSLMAEYITVAYVTFKNWLFMVVNTAASNQWRVA